jgi:hypothetical protein
MNKIDGVVPRAVPALASPAVTAAESLPSAASARVISRHGSVRVTLPCRREFDMPAQR